MKGSKERDDATRPPLASLSDPLLPSPKAIVKVIKHWRPNLSRSSLLPFSSIATSRPTRSRPNEVSSRSHTPLHPLLLPELRGWGDRRDRVPVREKKKKSDGKERSASSYSEMKGERATSKLTKPSGMSPITSFGGEPKSCIYTTKRPTSR